jgi:hypothetical protein
MSAQVRGRCATREVWPLAGSDGAWAVRWGGPAVGLRFVANRKVDGGALRKAFGPGPP